MLLVSSCLLVACNIDREPKGSMSSQRILEHPEEAIDGMTHGMYAQLKTWSDVMHRCGEYAGDNIMIRGASTDAFFEFISFNRTPQNYRLQAFWDNSYKAIIQASNIIELYGTSTDEEVKAHVGEAYFVRGFLYFYLVRAYGRPYYQDPEKNLGVPIIKSAPKDVFDKFTLPDRATVAETYAQAIEDLKQAETLLREDFMKYNQLLPESNKESIFVVRRLASEYSGYDHYYGVGGMYANIGGMGWGEMYASAKYLALLDETGRNDFRPNRTRIVDARAAFIEPVYAPEKTEVFRFIKSEESGDLNYVQLPITRSNGQIIAKEAKDSGQAESYTLTAIDANQEIYSITYKGKTYRGVIDLYIKLNRAYPMFYITKCSREGENSHLHSPVISRLGEVYLNRAEAEAKLGNYSAALTDLNIIRTRSIPGAAYASLDATNASERIDKERQLELAFQAERSYDVFRNGGSLVRRYPGAHHQREDIAPTDYRVVYFIPQNAIDAYPGKLTQNPTH